jgi:hypothetical protein
MKIPDYAFGHHERWEVELHISENELKINGKEISDKDRKLFVDNFIRANRNTYERSTSCPVCQAVIAEALLDGKDPFECPDGVRSILVKRGVDVESIQRARRLHNRVQHHAKKTELQKLATD